MTDVKYLVIKTKFGKGWNITIPAGEVRLMADSREAAWEFIRGNYNDTLFEHPELIGKGISNKDGGYALIDDNDFGAEWHIQKMEVERMD